MMMKIMSQTRLKKEMMTTTNKLSKRRCILSKKKMKMLFQKEIHSEEINHKYSKD
jgi:hypothetical protein